MPEKPFVVVHLNAKDEVVPAGDPSMTHSHIMDWQIAQESLSIEATCTALGCEKDATWICVCNCCGEIAPLCTKHKKALRRKGFEPLKPTIKGSN